MKTLVMLLIIGLILTASISYGNEIVATFEPEPTAEMIPAPPAINNAKAGK